eukprot:6602563-Prymnesium_polylepis.1
MARTGTSLTDALVAYLAYCRQPTPHIYHCTNPGFSTAFRHTLHRIGSVHAQAGRPVRRGDDGARMQC